MSAARTTRGQDLSEECSSVRYLDRRHTSFGQVTEGMNVVNRIARGDKIERAEIIEAK